MATTFSEIENAVDFVSMEPYGTNEAYVSLDTGQTFFLSQYGEACCYFAILSDFWRVP